MPTVKQLLISKRQPTLEMWLPFLEARMLFIRQLLDSITLAPLANMKVTVDEIPIDGGPQPPTGRGPSTKPEVEASLPIPRGHTGRPLDLQGLWHWTGDFAHHGTTDIWGLARGHYEKPVWARLQVAFPRPFRVTKIWLAECTFRDLCRELKRDPDYFWTTLGEDISRVVEIRQGLHEEALSWEAEMFGDDELLIEAGLLTPDAWSEKLAMRRLQRKFGGR